MLCPRTDLGKKNASRFLSKDSTAICQFGNLHILTHSKLLLAASNNVVPALRGTLRGCRLAE